MTTPTTKPATRAPLPPPFPVGTELRCIDREHETRFAKVGIASPDVHNPDHWEYAYRYGLKVQVCDVMPGRRGTGRLVDLGDGDEPFVDETTDGASVYAVPGTGQRRLIRREDVRKWEVCNA